ncbi:MAG: hypothetical protein Q9178_007112 [Gyalolechia marmorata]
MADRKRRLTENQEDYNRRRSASSLPFGPPMKTPQESGGLSNRGHDITFASRGHASSSSIMDRPLPRRPDVASHRHRESRDIILPRWQPDSEVTRCPICKTTFGFWYRKHHCRKCGRVVCANCSPHRITIPRQFIVQPPQDEDRTTREGFSAGIEVVDLTEDDNAGVWAPRSSTENQDTPRSPHIRIDPALGGGQEVRLCNPCVPDPNPSPHLPLEAPNLSAIHSFPRPSFDSVGISGTSSSSTQHSANRVQRPELDGGRGSSGSVPGARAQDHDSSRYLSRHSSRLPPPNYTSLVPSSRFRSVSDASLPPLPPHALPPRTQPQLREEDECPICHQALPPKGPNGSETEREAHVAECIAQHFSSSVPRASRPHPSVATEAAVVASAAGATQSQNSSSSAQRPQDRRGSESTEQGSNNHNNNAFERMGSQRRRVVGMIKYLATEKDCIGEAGEPAECVICFEEFEQGVEMGRLECLCKFHKNDVISCPF